MSHIRRMATAVIILGLATMVPLMRAPPTTTTTNLGPTPTPLHSAATQITTITFANAFSPAQLTSIYVSEDTVASRTRIMVFIPRTSADVAKD